jgi:DNA mismatch repair ATPase MutS
VKDVGLRINFSHAKYRYEIEVPIELVEGKLKPANFEFTSQRKDYQRFHTREVRKLVSDLELAEEELKDALGPFLSSMFSRFHDKKETWDSAVRAVSELDCIGSLAIVSG